jgi:hypothetical protein
MPEYLKGGRSTLNLSGQCVQLGRLRVIEELCHLVFLAWQGRAHLLCDQVREIKVVISHGVVLLLD